MTCPRLNVIMPTYNQAAFIEEAVLSILDQTFRNFRLVIVNDCSTDDTIEVLNNNQRIMADGRVQIIGLAKNIGTGGALNAGFGSVPPAEFETWFASDNVLYPTAFETLIRVADANPMAEYIYGDCEIRGFNKGGNEIYRSTISKEVGGLDFSIERLLKHYFLGIVWIWCHSLRMKAADGPLFSMDPCEDYDMVMRMAQAGGNFLPTPEILGWFRRHHGNMTNFLRTFHADPDFFSKEIQRKAIARGILR